MIIAGVQLLLRMEFRYTITHMKDLDPMRHQYLYLR